MATIEPRLIHLLNDSSSQGNPTASAGLPSFQVISLRASSERPPPLGLDAGHRPERFIGEGHQPQLNGSSQSQSSLLDELRRDGKYAPTSASVHPLRLLLSETEGADNAHTSKYQDSSAYGYEDAAIQKRPYGHNVKDDFVQLPQPLKKQRLSPQPPAMPPIISGLHEPPPHAALFPPMSSPVASNHDAYQMGALQAYNNSWEDKSNSNHSQQGHPSDKTTGKSRKRAAKPRRKWTEQETNHLLLGVNRHGVGKWTSILEDVDFSFNDRTAGDLKDRFRTCCPEELRNTKKGKDAGSPAAALHDAGALSNASSQPEHALMDEGHSDEAGPSQPESDSALAKRKKARAHRKRMEDLVELGICGPFKKSHRRERRPFTDKDDREILDGLEIYGPAWTKIQRDSRFGLSSRQPTDLRDRVRNKYPDVYQRIEKGVMQAKDAVTRAHDTLAPLLNTSAELPLRPSGSMTLEPRVHQNDSREEVQGWRSHPTDSSDNLYLSQPQDMADGMVPPPNGGEMDISRLLLDDPTRSAAANHADHGGLSGASSPSEPSSDQRRD